MESSQKFKKAIDEIEISAQLDSIVATAIERAKSEQTASSRKFLAVKKLCLAAAATLTICVGAGAAYQFYGIDRMKTADNAAASSQTETDVYKRQFVYCLYITLLHFTNFSV